jgi:hypothetical protein
VKKNESTFSAVNMQSKKNLNGTFNYFWFVSHNYGLVMLT